jgi:hypothetical protein
VAYSQVALAQRRCIGSTKSGRPCRAFATWDSGAMQLCSVHLGRHHRGPMGEKPTKKRRARNPNCRCSTYPFPHRPASGRCAWPQVAGYGRSGEEDAARRARLDAMRSKPVDYEEERAMILRRMGIRS